MEGVPDRDTGTIPQRVEVGQPVVIPGWSASRIARVRRLLAVVIVTVVVLIAGGVASAQGGRFPKPPSWPWSRIDCSKASSDDLAAIQANLRNDATVLEARVIERDGEEAIAVMVETASGTFVARFRHDERGATAVMAPIDNAAEYATPSLSGRGGLDADQTRAGRLVSTCLPAEREAGALIDHTA